MERLSALRRHPCSVQGVPSGLLVAFGLPENPFTKAKALSEGLLAGQVIAIGTDVGFPGGRVRGGQLSASVASFASTEVPPAPVPMPVLAIGAVGLRRRRVARAFGPGAIESRRLRCPCRAGGATTGRVTTRWPTFRLPGSTPPSVPSRRRQTGRPVSGLQSANPISTGRAKAASVRSGTPTTSAGADAADTLRASWRPPLTAVARTEASVSDTFARGPSRGALRSGWRLTCGFGEPEA